jgi:cell wall-associated NlpC family hydrolase
LRGFKTSNPPVDIEPVRRSLRILAVASGALALGVPAADAAARRVSTPPSWAAKEIALVVQRGLLPGVTAQTFDPDAPLDSGTLELLVAGALPSGSTQARVPSGSTSLTIGQLDAALVRASGLGPAAKAALAAIRRAGYAPRADVGVEVAARLLGLRYNHPYGEDALERDVSEPATRADAAYSVARVLGWSGWEVANAQSALALLEALPPTAGARHQALQTAIGLIGSPYVWGGEWETPDAPDGEVQAHGGFDCSGLLMRVLVHDPAAPPGLAPILGGRTTYDIAKSTKKPARLPAAAVQPGDVLLFGDKGRRSTWKQVGHVGLALGNGLMVHSSSQGVTIARWDVGWHADSFAWGKNVLGA